MFLAGLQVLSDGQYIYSPAALIAHYTLDFINGFTEADHDPGFSKHFRIELFGVR